MVQVSAEVPAQSEARLRAVMRHCTVDWLPGTWVFREGAEAETADAAQAAFARVSDEGRVSALMPGGSDGSGGSDGEVFAVFRVILPAGVDDSGFVGWFAGAVKAATGSGLFVICGYDRRRGGIYDYYGVPQGVAGEVRRVVTALAGEPLGAGGTVLRPAPTSLSPVFGPQAVFCLDRNADGIVARYGGGNIAHGMLAASCAADETTATFRYLHVDVDGTPRSGDFEGRLFRDASGSWVLSAPSVPGEDAWTRDPAPLVLRQA
jgi:hypothetical protein